MTGAKAQKEKKHMSNTNERPAKGSTVRFKVRGLELSGTYKGLKKPDGQGRGQYERAKVYVDGKEYLVPFGALL